MENPIKQSRNELKLNFQQVVHDYMLEWCKKHEYFYEPDTWVGDDVGGICAIGDLFVNFDDVRFDIDNDIPEPLFEEWYWYRLEISELGCERDVNLKSYSMGCRPYTEEQFENIRQAKKNVQKAQEILEDLIKNTKANGEVSN